MCGYHTASGAFMLTTTLLHPYKVSPHILNASSCLVAQHNLSYEGAKAQPQSVLPLGFICLMLERFFIFMNRRLDTIKNALHTRAQTCYSIDPNTLLRSVRPLLMAYCHRLLLDTRMVVHRLWSPASIDFFKGKEDLAVLTRRFNYGRYD